MPTNVELSGRVKWAGPCRMCERTTLAIVAADDSYAKFLCHVAKEVSDSVSTGQFVRVQGRISGVTKVNPDKAAKGFVYSMVRVDAHTWTPVVSDDPSDAEPNDIEHSGDYDVPF